MRKELVGGGMTESFRTELVEKEMQKSYPFQQEC